MRERYSLSGAFKICAIFILSLLAVFPNTLIFLQIISTHRAKRSSVEPQADPSKLLRWLNQCRAP